MTQWATSSSKTIHKAQHLYELLIELSENPAEAAEIVSYIHITLWLNGKADNANVDTMLDGYCKGFKFNIERQEATTQ